MRERLRYQGESAELQIGEITRQKIVQLKNMLAIENMQVSKGMGDRTEFLAVELYWYSEDREKSDRDINDLDVMVAKMKENQETQEVNLGNDSAQILIKYLRKENTNII